MNELDNKPILENISKHYKYYCVNPKWINVVEYVLNEMPGVLTEEKLRKILDDEKCFSFEYFIIKKDIIGILTSMTSDNCFSMSAFHPLYVGIATNDYFIVNMLIIGGGHDALLSLSDNTYTETLNFAMTIPDIDPKSVTKLLEVENTMHSLICGNNGDNALVNAIKYQSFEIMKILVEHINKFPSKQQYDIFSHVEIGSTFFDYALSMNRPDVVKLFLDSNLAIKFIRNIALNNIIYGLMDLSISDDIELFWEIIEVYERIEKMPSNVDTLLLDKKDKKDNEDYVRDHFNALFQWGNMNLILFFLPRIKSFYQYFCDNSLSYVFENNNISDEDKLSFLFLILKEFDKNWEEMIIHIIYICIEKGWLKMIQYCVAMGFRFNFNRIFSEEYKHTEWYMTLFNNLPIVHYFHIVFPLDNQNHYEFIKKDDKFIIRMECEDIIEMEINEKIEESFKILQSSSTLYELVSYNILHAELKEEVESFDLTSFKQKHLIPPPTNTPTCSSS